jgi:hypothetical protein
MLVANIQAARTFNGTSDFLNGAGVIGTGTHWTTAPSGATQAQGTLTFWVNIAVLPTGTTVNHLVGWGGTHCLDSTCTTTNNTCGSQVGNICNNVYLQAGTPNIIIDDLVQPGTGESLAYWTAPSINTLHNITITLNRTDTLMKMYLDGTLQTQQGQIQNGDPGGGNNLTFGPLVVGAGLKTTGQCCFANATISDFAYWPVTLSVNEIKSLANCVPPNRIQPESVAYFPIYGVDSPEPEYLGAGTSVSPAAPRTLTVTGTVAKPGTNAGCQAGGAYAP